MPIIQFSEKDIKRGIIVDPAWYRCRIDETGEKLTKAGDSTNFLMSAIILHNADNGEEKFAGVPVDWNFNSKGLGYMVKFVEALGEEVTPESRFELNDSVSREVDIFIKTGSWEGRPKNEPSDYRVPREA